MDRSSEPEEPFGFDGRSLEEQLAALDAANSGRGDGADQTGPSGRAAGNGSRGQEHGPRGAVEPRLEKQEPGDAQDEESRQATESRQDDGGEPGQVSPFPQAPQEPPGPSSSEVADRGGAQTGIWSAWPYAVESPGWPPPSSDGWYPSGPENDQGQRSGAPEPQPWPGGAAWQQWEHQWGQQAQWDQQWDQQWSQWGQQWGQQWDQQWSGEPAWGPAPSAPEYYSDPAPAPQQDLPEGRYAYPPGPQQEADPYQSSAPSSYTGAPASGPPVQEPQTADSLRPETLLRGRRRAPARGWRRAVYRMTGGLIHPGESPAELRRRQLVARGRTVVAGGHHRVAVLSLKGGVGKTTTTIGLGSTLAALRGDRVVAIDANPDRGTLSDKLHLETAATVRDLLNERDNVRRYADVRAFTSQAPSRLEVLASDRDPAVSEAFSEDDYRAVAEVLEHFYSVCITDCGTGLLHSAMSGVLRLANQIVLVSSPSVDGARSASATLDWLEAHEFGELVRNATVVLSGVHESSKSSVDLTRLEQHFAARCNAVIRIPQDPHLEEGAEVELDHLKPLTRDAYLTLAAAVGDGFGSRRGAAVSFPAADAYGGGPA